VVAFEKVGRARRALGGSEAWWDNSVDNLLGAKFTPLEKLP
jgi:hypothetical protein